MNRIQGFPPLCGSRPRVLVLGSAPSVASLEKQQYYGRPQNSFWKIMGELFAAGPELDYPARAIVLTSAGVAVWDVLASCVRPGSLDSSIDMRTAEVNPLSTMLTREPTIRHVFFNGRKSEEIFDKRVRAEVSRTNIEYACLPSSSPAMAALNFAAKLQQWQAVEKAAAKT